jgi:hypothetical protein
MIKRAVFARELGVPIVMHDYLTGGFTFILAIPLSFVLSYSSNGTQFISLSSIIDKVQRKRRFSKPELRD